RRLVLRQIEVIDEPLNSLAERPFRQPCGRFRGCILRNDSRGRARHESGKRQNEQRDAASYEEIPHRSGPFTASPRELVHLVLMAILDGKRSWDVHVKS